MAQGAIRVLLDKKRSGKYEVISSGTSAATGFPATAYAIEAAKIWNANISGHKSQPLTRELIDRADLIFALTPSHFRDIVSMRKDAVSRTFLLKEFPNSGPDGEGVDDPIGQSLDRYNETFLEIGECLGKHLDEIVKRLDEKVS